MASPRKPRLGVIETPTNGTPKTFPPLDKDMYRVVLTAFADERLANQRAVMKAVTAVLRSKRTADERISAYAEEIGLKGAQDAYALHKDILPLVKAGKVSQKDYDEEERRLKSALDHADRSMAEFVEQQKAQHEEVVRPYQELAQKESHPVHGYAARWKLHAKRAEQLGIDLDEFWHPGLPLPAGVDG